MSLIERLQKFRGKTVIFPKSSLKFLNSGMQYAENKIVFPRKVCLCLKDFGNITAQK